jgi:hypothetical protein
VDNTGVPASGVLRDNLVGVKILRHLQNRACSLTGALDVYTVTGDADVLWRRMLRSGEDLRMAQTEAAGRRIRFVHQSGFDYDLEAALTEGSELGALLAVRSCG